MSRYQLAISGPGPPYVVCWTGSLPYSKDTACPNGTIPGQDTAAKDKVSYRDVLQDILVLGTQ